MAVTIQELIRVASDRLILEHSLNYVKAPFPLSPSILESVRVFGNIHFLRDGRNFDFEEAQDGGCSHSAQVLQENGEGKGHQG